MVKRAGWGTGAWGAMPWGFDDLETLPDVPYQPIGAAAHVVTDAVRTSVVHYSTVRTSTPRVSTRLP